MKKLLTLALSLVLCLGLSISVFAKDSPETTPTTPSPSAPLGQADPDSDIKNDAVAGTLVKNAGFIVPAGVSMKVVVGYDITPTSPGVTPVPHEDGYYDITLDVPGIESGKYVYVIHEYETETGEQKVEVFEKQVEKDGTIWVRTNHFSPFTITTAVNENGSIIKLNPGQSTGTGTGAGSQQSGGTGTTAPATGEYK